MISFMRNRLNLQAGFTLLEASLVLVITGIVIGGLWVLGSNLFFTQKVNLLEKGILTTATRIRNFYRDRQMQNDKTNNVSNINNTNFIQMDLIAPELASNTTTNTISFSPAFNGPGTVNITYDIANCKPQAANSFAMSLINITQDACNQIVPSLVGTSGQIQSNNIVGLFIGSTNVLTATTTNNITSYSFNPVTAEQNCVDGTTVEICFAQ